MTTEGFIKHINNLKSVLGPYYHKDKFTTMLESDIKDKFGEDYVKYSKELCTLKDSLEDYVNISHGTYAICNECKCKIKSDAKISYETCEYIPYFEKPYNVWVMEMYHVCNDCYIVRKHINLLNFFSLQKVIHHTRSYKLDNIRKTKYKDIKKYPSGSISLGTSELNIDLKNILKSGCEKSSSDSSDESSNDSSNEEMPELISESDSD